MKSKILSLFQQRPQQEIDLDEIFEKIKSSFSGGFGGFGPQIGRFFIPGILLALILVWAATGLYRVEPSEQAAEKLLGSFTNNLRGPGLHWFWPAPIGQVQKEVVTENKAESNEIEDLKFANKIVKHSKSNAIVLVKNKQMISSGVGQTSRVDALKFAIDKAKVFKLDVRNSAMASDAFFPFPDCIEIASRAGISSVVQPGGSIKDNLSVDACNDKGMSMYLSGIRHFYH